MKLKHELALELITHYEGFSKTAYVCPAGITTIGYGRTTGSMLPTTRKAERYWLLSTINDIDKVINKKVSRKLNQHQMAALISFIYNLGIGAFTKSTLLRLLNQGKDFNFVGNEFLRWSKAGNSVLPGLAKRRMAEYLLFTNQEFRLI